MQRVELGPASICALLTSMAGLPLSVGIQRNNGWGGIEVRSGEGSEREEGGETVICL